MPSSTRRRWLHIATAGVVLVVLVMIVVALVLIDKPRFGSLVGRNFLVFLSSGVFVGALLLLIAAWNVQERRTWRGITLMIWALIALTSPGFGFLFLAPWGVLVLSLPLVISILVAAYRQA